MNTTWDVIILGGGPAGFMTALSLQMAGKKVCLIDSSVDRLGGVCLHEGCMPTKSLLKTAEIYDQLLNAQQYGITATVEPINLHRAVERKNGHLKALNSHIHEMVTNTGLHVEHGHGRFISANTVEVANGGQRSRHRAATFLIATGSRPMEMEMLPTDGQLICNSSQMLNTTELPKHLLVVGGGAIGCEFASMYRAFGADVTVVESADHLLPREDEDTGNCLQASLESRGVTVLTGSQLHEAQINSDDVTVDINGATTGPLVFDKVLVAVGRQPNTDLLWLQAAQVLTKGSFIEVNGQLQTSQPHIYAAGDVISTMMLAHTAMQESDVVVANLLGQNNVLQSQNVPRVVYSFPQVAAVGATEKELPEDSYRVLYQPFAENGKAVVDQRLEGHVKLLVDKKTDQLLGATIVGDHATELIHELVLAITQKLPLSALQQTVHAHPTLAESIWKLAKSAA